MNRWEYEEEGCPLVGFGNVLKCLIVACLLFFLLCGVFGCSSVRYGTFAATSFGTDISASKASWEKYGADGSYETLEIDKGSKNGSESAHIGANLLMGIVTSLTGAAVNKSDPVKGAAVGLAGGISLTEVWQTIKEKAQQ